MSVQMVPAQRWPNGGVPGDAISPHHQTKQSTYIKRRMVRKPAETPTSSRSALMQLQALDEESTLSAIFAFLHLQGICRRSTRESRFSFFPFGTRQAEPAGPSKPDRRAGAGPVAIRDCVHFAGTCSKCDFCALVNTSDLQRICKESPISFFRLEALPDHPGSPISGVAGRANAPPCGSLSRKTATRASSAVRRIPFRH